MPEDSILATRDGRIGRIVLNRPQALNALDIGMIRALTTALAAWRDDPAVHAVAIEGAGGRAFSAGGDVRAIRTHALAHERAPIEAFFSEEYALNRMIAEYPKPYIALIDGICMGGGIGLSVHGRVRVATEAATFAMPETAIAMFPDVGGSFALPRLPGALGIFLGLTGTRLAGADAVHAGLATHFVPKSQFPPLSAALPHEGVAAVAAHARTLPPFALAPHRAAIDRCFGADSVADILTHLQTEATDWAREMLTTLRAMSPSSVLWSFEVMRRGAHLPLPDCLAMELKLTRHVTAHPDFAEGVRAMVVDKDRTPKWQPARIEEVPPAAIDAMFT